MSKKHSRILITAWVLVVGFSVAAAELQEVVQERILVKPRNTVVLQRLGSVYAAIAARVDHTFSQIGNLQVVTLPPGVKGADVIQALVAKRLVEYAEPDYPLAADSLDPYWGRLWGLENTGQKLQIGNTSDPGTADADIDAPEAWAAAGTPSQVIVAIIDTGVRYTHEDLTANMWMNPGEIPGNKKDDDGNGLVDDVYGAKFLLNLRSGDPLDDNGHGTHVAGTIAAVGDNSKGVIGVAYKNARLMALKFLNNKGSGYTSDAIKCVDYAIAKGAQVINASFGGGAFSQAMYDAINRARAAGIVFVAAAGNDGLNNDATAHYPSSYNLDNIISVAATDNDDQRPSWSNYGATSVDLAAPGANIVSSYISGKSNSAYAWASGTSMATPHVTGAVALLRGVKTGENYAQIINRVLLGVDQRPALIGKTVTGGRLNLNNSLLLP